MAPVHAHRVGGGRYRPIVERFRGGLAVVVVLLGLEVVGALTAPADRSAHITDAWRLASRGCGIAALLAAAAQSDDAAVVQLGLMLEADPSLGRGAVTLEDLRAIARRAGMRAGAVWSPRPDADGIAAPFVAHFRPGHFVAVLGLDHASAVVADAPGQRRVLSRREFDTAYSGAALALRPIAPGAGE